MFPLDLEKSEEPEIKLPTSAGYAKAFDCVDHNKLWKILTEMGVPDHLTCLLKNLYAGQKAIVRTGEGSSLIQKNALSNNPVVLRFLKI